MIAIPSRHQVIDKVKRAGGKIAAILPIFYPRELLRAYGFQPIEVWGPPNVKAQGQDHFQAYTCPIVRNATSFLLNGGLDPADALLVPHTCDSLQGMGSVLNDFIKPKQPVLTLYHPRAHREPDLQFLISELKRIGESLSIISSITPSEEDLLVAIQREVDADTALQTLYTRRYELDLSDQAFYQLIRSREYLPAEEFTALVGMLSFTKHSPSGVGICISGIIPEPMSLFEQINDAGAYIACDDLACGARRMYDTQVTGTPFEQMAKRLLHTPPEPTKGNSVTNRVDHLLTKMQTFNAKGMLVYDVKFCEPELFDLPHLKAALAQQGIPLLHVEHELNGKLDEQTLTRISAFIEVLQ